MMAALAFLLLAALCAAYLRPGEAPAIREAIVKGTLTFGVWVVAVTEIASPFNAVTRPLLIALYAPALAIAVFFLFVGGKAASIRDAGRRIAGIWGRLEPAERALLTCGVVIGLATFVNSLIAAPNNYDSLSYHIARVAEWIQHRNVSYFSTWNGKQNFDSPFAEFLVLHLQLLSASDQFANLTQWHAFLLSAIMASLVAREFGQSRRIQILSALVAYTIPMAILQSTSTQNDMVCAAMCIVFAFFLLAWLRTAAVAAAVFSGIGLGLAVLSKPTADFWCFSLGLLLFPASHLLRERNGRSQWLGHLALTLAVALSLNAGVFTRNWHAYHSPLADPSPESYTVAHPSLGTLFSVSVRNIALHFRTPSGAVNNMVSTLVHRLLGSRINDPSSTYGHTHMKFDFTNTEDDAGNPLQLVLAALSFLALPWIRTNRRRLLWCYGLSILLGNLLFSLILRWQPWGTRLQLPFFVLAAPLIAIALGAFSARRFRLPVFLAAAAVICLFAVLFRAAIRDDAVYWGAVGLALVMLAFVPGGKLPALIGLGAVALFAPAFYLLPAGALRLATGLGLLGILFLLVVLALARTAAPGEGLALSCASVLFVYAISFALVNPDHPLVPCNGECVFTSSRLWQYSRYHLDRYNDYRAAVGAALAHGGGVIGLYSGGDDPEYFLWALAGSNAKCGPPELRHVGVTGRWAEAAPPAPPEIVLATKPLMDGRLMGRAYIPIFQSPLISVFQLLDASR